MLQRVVTKKPAPFKAYQQDKKYNKTGAPSVSATADQTLSED